MNVLFKGNGRDWIVARKECAALLFEKSSILDSGSGTMPFDTPG
jgi:hypothetical protein